MKAALAVCVALVAGGCQPAKPTALDAAKAAAAYDALDPASVQFRGVVEITGTGPPDYKLPRNFVCGQMNAKNRLGAYTGFTKFIYGIPETRVLSREPPERSGATAKELDAKCLYDTRHLPGDNRPASCDDAQAASEDEGARLAFAARWSQSCGRVSGPIQPSS